MLKTLMLRLRLRAVRGDIRYAESLVRHAEQQQRHIEAWRRDEAALVCELAQIPRTDWRSIAFASGLGALLAFVLACPRVEAVLLGDDQQGEHLCRKSPRRSSEH